MSALIDEVEREAAQVCDALRAPQVYARITVHVERISSVVNVFKVRLFLCR